MSDRTARRFTVSRISRDGAVYGREHRGDRETLLGHVWIVRGGWRNDQASNIYPRQTDAARALADIVRPVN